MDIAPVTSTHAAERIAALWLEIAALADGAETTSPHADGQRGAQAQTHAQPLVQPLRSGPAAIELLQPGPNAGLADPHARPDSALVPATRASLRADPAALWGLPRSAFDADAPGLLPMPIDEDADGRADADDEASDPGAFEVDGVDDAVAVDGPDVAWCAALGRKLRQVLAARAPVPLMALAAQWQRGRCTMLVCPQGVRGGASGWAFVLWPYPPSDGSLLPALYGVRVAARLGWQAQLHGADWVHARLMREHHRRHGRQLVAADRTPAAGRMPCLMQLGPVAQPNAPAAEVRVQIDAVQRVWAALGRQWSVHLAVCSAPLLPMEVAR